MTAPLRVLIVLAGVSAIAACAHGDSTPYTRTAEAPDRVLFVGNSFTYYNNSLHNHYEELLRAARPDAAERMRVRIMTISGGRLPEHRAGLESLLEAEPWDAVVLQGHSRAPLGDDSGAEFVAAAKDYADMIRARGAEPVLFMTWAYTGQPDMTSQLASVYTLAGSETGARVAPVGHAFATVTRERPDIELRIADRRHPALAGTYLAACVFFSVLRGESPEGNPYRAGLDADVAHYLQRVAWQTVRDYGT